MAAKKKSKKQHPKVKRTAAKKGRPIRKTVRKKASKKKLVKKKPALKRTAAKTKALGKKKAEAKTGRGLAKRSPGESQKIDADSFSSQGRRSRSAGQSGDLQGLSHVEAADSESVEELIEEGNAFEADVVAGVERAGNDRMKEVRTHEVPEDDVPGEYLDEE
jgi:hypothetical protein